MPASMDTYLMPAIHVWASWSFQTTIHPVAWHRYGNTYLCHSYICHSYVDPSYILHGVYPMHLIYVKIYLGLLIEDNYLVHATVHFVTSNIERVAAPLFYYTYCSDTGQCKHLDIRQFIIRMPWYPLPALVLPCQFNSLLHILE